jgi:hypothetical protein
MSAMGDGLVQLAYLHSDRVSHSFHVSMMRIIAHDAGTSGRMVNTAGPIMVQTAAGELSFNRNLATAKFLDETPHEWLWFVDTDMGFKPDVVDQLLAAADPDERPVVGALCFSMRPIATDGFGGCRVAPVPTLFMPALDATTGVRGFKTRFRYPERSIVQVGATGTGCLLIHRSVLEKMRADLGDEWFTYTRFEGGGPISEDFSFMVRLLAMGVPVFVHTGVPTTHHKPVWIGAQDYRQPAEEFVPDAEQVQ